MKRFFKWASVPIVLVVGVVVWLAVGSADDAMIQSQDHAVTKGDLLISVTEPGTLKALKETPITCELEGRDNRILYLIDEGKTVKKGELLVEFETAELQTKINRQEIEYQSALSAFKQAKERLEIRKSQNATDIRAAELKLKFAKMDLRKYKEGQWPLDLKKQESAITLVQDELISAKGRLQWTRVLEKKGYATRADLESDELKVKRKELDLEQEKERLKMMKTYDYPQNLARNETDVTKFEQELDRTKRNSAAELAQAQYDYRAKEANFKSSDEQLKKLKLELVKSKVLAPQDGLVVYHKEYWRGETIEVGATVRNRQRLINLPDTSVLTVDVKVHESRISQVGVDQLAYVTLDTLPGRRFKGKVRQVAPMPDPQSWWNPGLKVYSVEVLIEDKMPEDVKPGLSTKVEIIIDKLEGVLAVPIQAITTVDKKQRAYVKTDDGMAVRHVTVGSFNDTHVEIKEGLEEGDRILLAPPSKDEALAMGLSIVDSSEVNKEDVVEGKKPTGGRPKDAAPTGRPRSMKRRK